MRTKVDILQKKKLLEHHPSSCVFRFRFLVSEFSPLILAKLASNQTFKRQD
jgi:hypothetical protein